MGIIQIQIYTPELASAVADMWNASRDSWGGASNIKTTEQVLQEEANSDSMFVFLALDEDRVVGYCSLCEYREDTGALYIGLLNVDPGYHGQKIGKLLVLESINKTIELRWPRLDLYTWTGNTKAVPLYKKCGFFWEDRDDTTHLMNFIPTVLSTEAIQEFFREADWYQDCTRQIVVEPDGRKDNGYDYFEYEWKHNENELRVEFERRGRGLRLIETNDYRIVATVQNLDLVFGSNYTITYEIINKTGKPLDVSLEGMNNRNITFDYKTEVNVTDRTVLTGQFYVGPVNEEQSIWRTHPCVTTNVLINGQKALFLIGINPKYPAKIKTIVPGTLQFLHKDAVLYLDMENSFTENAVFTFTLPTSSLFHLGQYEYTIALGSQERQSIPIAYHLLAHGFYEAEIEITAQLGDRQIRFHKQIGIPFVGIGAQLAGECEDYWLIANGKHICKLSKLNNELVLGHTTKDAATEILQPKLGKPYSSEFSKRRPEQVEFFEEGGGIGMEATYHSTDFKSIVLRAYTLLYADGTIRHWYEIHNRSEEQASLELSLLNPIYHSLHRSILPYKGQCIEMEDSQGREYNDWDANLVSENWLFSKGNTSSPRGICWSNSHTIHFQGWHFTLESAIGILQPKETRTTDPIYISLGGFADWEEFRTFALQQSVPSQALPALVQPLELDVNNHNPFIGLHDEAMLKLKEHKLHSLEGEIKAGLDHNRVHIGQSHIYTEDQMAREASYTIPMPLTTKSTAIPLIANVDAKFATHTAKLNQVLFPIQKAHIVLDQTTQSAKSILSADNGIIRIQASADFSPSLFSMQYKENEWLDTAFPEMIAKSWWNPWMGGISSSPQGLNAYSQLKEHTEAEFTTLIDSKQNTWQGINMRHQVTKHERYKGLTFEQYYILLPGVPVLAYTTKIVQNTGTYFNNLEWSTNMFLRPAEDKTQGWFKTINPNQMELTYWDQGKEIEALEQSSYVFGSNQRQEMLQVVTDEASIRSGAYLNKEIVNLTYHQLLNMKNGDTLFTSPVFYVFTEQIIKESALSALKKIRFGV